MLGNMMLSNVRQGGQLPMGAGGEAGQTSTAPGVGAPGNFANPGAIGGSANAGGNLFGQQGYQPQQFGGYNAGMANPMMSMLMNLFGGGGGGSDPTQQLGQLSSGMGYLNNIASGYGAGAPINQTPAWQAMVNAQNYNIQSGADNLAEQFNKGGGLFSTAYGNAQGQYQEQARLGQNAQLTSAATQAMQQANQNQLGAAQQLSGQGYGALGQLSGQQFQGNQLASNQRFGAAQQAAQLSANGINQGLQGNSLLGNLWQQNLQTGGQLGNSQLGANQNQLTAAFQNWLYQQPTNNPLLQLMFAQANAYPQQQQGTYIPGALGSLLSGTGSLLGGIGSLAGFFG